MIITTLDKLKISQSAVVVDIKSDINLKTRLMILGLTNGTTIILNRIAPFGDPLDIIVRHYHLLIRKEEAKKIIIKIG